MKRRGFTLIELLATIVVLGIIGTIAINLVIKYINSSKRDLLQTQKNEIVQAAKDWAMKNPSDLDKYHLNNTYISIETLKKDGFLENKKIKNPVTGDEMIGCVVATYQESNKSYNFIFDDTSCTELMEQNPVKVPAINYILENEAANENSTLIEENNYYVYKGVNPNNYIKVDNNIWRIISIDKESMNLKIVLTTYDVQKEWNNSTDETVDLSFMSSSLMNDLNNSNIITDTISRYIENNSAWYSGDISNSSDRSFTSINSVERQSKLNLNVGLVTASEYIEASADTNCRMDYINSCLNDNYLNFNKNYWLLNNSSSSLTKIENGNISFETNKLNVLYVYPVIYLNYGVQITGSGTSENPYTIY